MQVVSKHALGVSFICCTLFVFYCIPTCRHRQPKETKIHIFTEHLCVLSGFMKPHYIRKKNFLKHAPQTLIQLQGIFITERVIKGTCKVALRQSH